MPSEHDHLHKKPPGHPCAGRFSSGFADAMWILFLDPADGFHEEFACGFETEFLADVCLVGIDCFGTEFQFGGDAVRVHATSNHLEDFELAVAEQAARLTT